MVLWEVTLTTAYFLGLKRTYKLALRIQRRLIGPNNPKILLFLHRRTRAAFDVAVKVHKNIQQRDIEAGRNLGNLILRWLDRMKPSAQIRPHPEQQLLDTNDMPQNSIKTQRLNATVMKQESSGRLHFSPMNIQPKSFAVLPMVMQQSRKPTSMNGQGRHMSFHSPCSSTLEYKRGLLAGVLRKDIAQWMLHH